MELSAEYLEKYPQYAAFDQGRKEVIEREEAKRKAGHTKDFEFTSANLSRFLPEVPRAAHWDIYMQIIYSNVLLSSEVKHPGIIEDLKMAGDTEHLKSTFSKPAIYCTYHLGSYRSIIGLLVKEQVDFVLLVDENTYRKQQGYIQETVERIRSHFQVETSFELIEAERYDIGLQLAKSLMAGKSVVAYLDGNTGVGGVMHKSEQFLPIDFLGQKLLSRKGIAMVSYLSGYPIVPVISHYPSMEERPVLHWESPIYPDRKKQSKEEFSRETTQLLYGILEDWLKKYYDQWEGWVYLHKYLDFDQFEKKSTNSVGAEEEWIINDLKYAVFKLDDQAYLFDRLSYQSYSISMELFDFVRKGGAHSRTSLIEQFTESSFNELAGVELLIPTVSKL